MTYKKYIMTVVLVAGVVLMACRDESLYPLPYDNRTSGAYLRMYKVISNVWDVNDLSNSGFEVIYEAVDKSGGAELASIDFYATFRSGATGRITNETLVKTVTAAQGGFATVPAPTYSEYLRSAPIRVTANETLAALATLTTDPDNNFPVGNTCSGIFPNICALIAYPGSVVQGDQIIYRWLIRLTDGRTFSVANPQSTVNANFGNPLQANLTPNITGGQFYNSPSIYTVLVQSLLANSWVGDFRMTQQAIWSPSHSVALHGSSYPSHMDEFLFGNSTTDSTQTVTLAMVPGGLTTERQLTCKYRGQTISMRVNFERAVLNQVGAGLTGANGAAALTTLANMGFPAGTTNANLGTVFVPLVNSGVDCTTNRELFMVTPLGGFFLGTAALRWGLPRSTHPNRGFYRHDGTNGQNVGDTFSIAVDDDCDEYGRRNGYCGFFRRVYLTLTKL